MLLKIFAMRSLLITHRRFAMLALAACLSSSVQAAVNTWIPAGDIKANCGNSALLLPSGKVLVDCSYADVYPGVLSLVQYDPANHTWNSTPDTNPRSGLGTRTLLPSGKVLVAGGGSRGSGVGIYSISSSNRSDLYDPVANSWSVGSSLGTARYDQTATLLRSGKVLIVGGRGGPAPLRSAELYDPTSNTWGAAAFPWESRSEHTATLLNSGKVLIVGGFISYPGGPDFSASSELYDPASDSWSQTANMRLARWYHTATLLPSGKVLVAGGAHVDALASAELYDPDSNTWSDAANLNFARLQHTATLLGNGKVLVAGGAQNIGDPFFSGPAVSSAELYDSSTDTWSAVGNLGTARTRHAATLLNSGEVLVVGGVDAHNIVVRAERFQPEAIAADAPTILPTLSPTWLAVLATIVAAIGAKALLRSRSTER
jgi:hypothetical protein